MSGARHIERITIGFQADVARLTALKLTAAQIAGVLKCKPARVDWARRKLGLPSQAGPHQRHASTPFRCERSASGPAIADPGIRYREPDGVSFGGVFQDDPRACAREAIWRDKRGWLP